MSKGHHDPVKTEPGQGTGHGRLTDPPMKKKIAIFGGFVLFVVLLGLSWFLWPTSELSWARRIIDDSTIYSMSKSEIDNRLGQPDNPEGYFNGWDYVYYLEPDSLGIDSWWLIVNVDDAGQVMMARVLPD